MRYSEKAERVVALRVGVGAQAEARVQVQRTVPPAEVTAADLEEPARRELVALARRAVVLPCSQHAVDLQTAAVSDRRLRRLLDGDRRRRARAGRRARSPRSGSRRNSPSALSRRRLSVSAASPSGLPSSNCSSRWITLTRVRRLPVMKMCSTIVCGPSTILNVMSARAVSGVDRRADRRRRHLGGRVAFVEVEGAAARRDRGRPPARSTAGRGRSVSTARSRSAATVVVAGERELADDDARALFDRNDRGHQARAGFVDGGRRSPRSRSRASGRSVGSPPRSRRAARRRTARRLPSGSAAGFRPARWPGCRSPRRRPAPTR